MHRVTLWWMRRGARAGALLPAPVPAQGTRKGVLGDKPAR